MILESRPLHKKKKRLAKNRSRDSSRDSPQSVSGGQGGVLAIMLQHPHRRQGCTLNIQPMVLPSPETFLLPFPAQPHLLRPSLQLL